MATTGIQKMIDNLSENKGVQNLLENFQKLNDEIKKRESDLKHRFDQEKQDKIELAWKKYQNIVKALSTSESKLEKEVNTTISKIKKSATSLEKNIASYKKKAIAQRTKLEKAIFKKAAKKQAAKKTTTKKATTKKVATKKTTKKVAGK